MKKQFGSCKGYIESYFLYLMSIICVLSSLQLSIINEASKVLININEVYDKHWNKVLVINWINNNLAQIVEGTYNYQDIEFIVSVNDDILEIMIINDNSQIRLLVNEDKIVKIL